MQHIRRRHRRHRPNLLHAHLALAPIIHQDAHHRFLPVRPVAQQSEVGEGFLGGPELAFPLRELVAEGDEELAVAFALVLREREDAGDVVALGGFFFLGEVADEVAAVSGAGGHAVEEERVHVVVERLMIEEQFTQQTEITTPGPLPSAVDLEEGDVVVAVDFVAGRVHERAFRAVSLKGPFTGEIAQAELADMDDFLFGEGEGVGREIPRFHFVSAHGEASEVAHAGDLGLVLGHGAARAEFFDFFLAGVGDGGGGGRGLCGGGGVLHVEHVDVFVFGFGRVGCEFRGEDGEGVVGILTVFFPAGEGGADGACGIFIAG